MRIVIDMQGVQTESRYRGIGRYSYSIVQSIVRNAPNHEIWLIANAKLPESIPEIREAFNGLVPNEYIRIFDVPHSEKLGDWTNLAAEVIREGFIDALKPDVILITSVFEGHWSNAVTSIGAYRGNHKTVAILYDLIPFIYPDKYLPSSELKEYYYRKIDWIKNADLLLAISNSSRNEAITHLGIDEDKIINISTAIDAQFGIEVPDYNDVSILLKNLGINSEFVLYAPGGFDSRKNFARLIEAFSLLPARIRLSYQLVIVSKLSEQQRDELNRIATQYDLSEKELVLTNYVDDKVLIKLYKLASLFVFPSLHEGFGLPVLEAMACGVPVIGSNITSIPEVIGLPEALFNPKSVGDITDKILRGLTDKAFRKLLLMHQKKQVARFSWDKTAQIAILALEELNDKPKLENNKVKNIINFLVALPQTKKVEDFSLREVANCIAFNQIRERRQLLLDISTIVHVDARSGIQRVVRSLLKQLLDNACEDFEVKPIYFDGTIYRYANKFCQEKFNKPITDDDTAIALSQGDIYLSLDLNMHLSSMTQKLHENLNRHGVRMIYIVYDILLARHPEWWESQNSDLFLNWLKNIGEVATDLICISNTVADDVNLWFKEHPPERIEFGPNIHSFHLGADVENSIPSIGMPDSNECILKKIVEKPSFLMVGTIEPRKGHEQVLNAFEVLWSNNSNINLVIVGKQGWKVDDLINRIKLHPEFRKHIFWLDEISDEYLEKIYSAATCLIAASYGEGFGLPLIEAAQHKLPIIARDLPVFQEVAGDYAYYFSASAPGELAQSINAWLHLYDKGSHPKSFNIPWLTWQESAESLMRILLDNNEKRIPQ